LIPLYVTILNCSPRRILVGTAKGGLYWSDDFARWQRAEGIPDIQVSDIKRIPGSSAKLMAATPSGLFESFDWGSQWSRVKPGPEYSYCMVVNPLDDEPVLVGTSGGGAYRQDAGELSWYAANEGFPSCSRGTWVRLVFLFLPCKKPKNQI
jgi:hypothetical protein